MLNKLLSNIVIIVLSLVVLIIVAGWFYWFQWRPSEIRKECQRVREEYIKEKRPTGFSIQDIPALKFRYERCLNEKGLK